MPTEGRAERKRPERATSRPASLRAARWLFHFLFNSHGKWLAFSQIGAFHPEGDILLPLRIFRDFERKLLIISASPAMLRRNFSLLFSEVRIKEKKTILIFSITAIFCRERHLSPPGDFSGFREKDLAETVFASSCIGIFYMSL